MNKMMDALFLCCVLRCGKNGYADFSAADEFLRNPFVIRIRAIA